MKVTSSFPAVTALPAAAQAPGACADAWQGLPAIRLRLAGPQWAWVYREIDPDVFGEQLTEPGYEQVERIAAVALTVTRSR